MNITPWFPNPKIAANLPPEWVKLVQQQSLTWALRQMKADFSVRLLYLGAMALPAFLADDEVEKMGVGRDVYLCLNDEPVVWARSWCGADADMWQEVLDCGNRPLGERLFDGTLPLMRSPFEYASGQAVSLPMETSEAMLLRRSVFTWQPVGEQLILVECFLPALKQFLNSSF